MEKRSAPAIFFFGLALLSLPFKTESQTVVAPSVSFVVYPNVLEQGKSLTVEWNTQNVSACSGSFAEKDEDLPPIGSRVVRPQFFGKSSYTITCTNADGSQSVSQSKTVIVREAGIKPLALPAVQFTADKKSVQKGDQVTIFWEAKDAFACAGTGSIDFLGLKHTTGTLTFSPQTSASLSLHCWNENGELGPPASLLISVTGSPILSIPEEEFSNRTFGKSQNGSGAIPPLKPALCDRSATDFKRTKTVQCGRITWKFTSPTIALLGKDPLPYLYKYHEYYTYLQDFLQFEPPVAPLRIIEDKFIASLKFNAVSGEIRIPSAVARAGFAKAAILPAHPLFLPIAKSVTTIFLSHIPQRFVFLWHPLLIESFTDIIGVSGYLAQSDRVTQVFWHEAWCLKRGKGKLCDTVLKTPDQFASISQDAALARQKVIRSRFDDLFSTQKGSILATNGAELFSAVTMLIHRDLESVGRGNDFSIGLQETMRFMSQWEGFPDPFRISSYTSDIMKRKLNLFIFLLSIHTGTDFSWYYERFGFPVTQETKNLIARFLARRNLDSIGDAIGILAGTASQSAESTPSNTGSGLRGLYYDTERLDDLKVSRIDTAINFDWGRDAPAPTVHHNTFSIRWTGLVEPKYSGEYTFYTLSDDGVRLWVDNKKIIDNWGEHAITDDKGTVMLSAGKKYPIQLEYFEKTQNAVIKLYWSSKQQAKEIIPTSQLYPL